MKDLNPVSKCFSQLTENRNLPQDLQLSMFNSHNNNIIINIILIFPLGEIWSVAAEPQAVMQVLWR